ncbi:MAG TPA: fasciclin domain-containing protein, partial [Phenylobacterium sp.]|nr:fasciclin domain-containing protein [Phenylobacterium sp.]
MYLNRILTTTAALALMAGVAQAQTATKPAKAPAAAVSAAKSTAAPAATAPSGATAETATAGSAQIVAAGDIVATAKASGQFTTFLKAAEATNLTSLLRDNKNLTVFAPTDAAFAKLPAGTVEMLV